MAGDYFIHRIDRSPNMSESIQLESISSTIIEEVRGILSAQSNLLDGGDITEQQLISPPSKLGPFSGAMKDTWQHLVKRLFRKSMGTQSNPVLDLFCSWDFEKPNLSFAKLEGMTKAAIENRKFTIVEIVDQLTEQNKDDITRYIPYIESFLLNITSSRFLRNHIQHHVEPDYKLEDSNLILDYLNDVDFKHKILQQGKGAIAIVHLLLTENIRTPEFQKDIELFEKNANSEIRNSMDAYRQRLDQLIWGPKQYSRSDEIITDAHAALNKHQILSFYGIGGVGKTALAQKLMFDVINNEEPYTHIITFSSKVGSDQKEINTIDIQRLGTKVDTSRDISVMDGSRNFFDGEFRLGGLHSFLSKVYQEVKGTDPGRVELPLLKKSVLKLLGDKTHKVLMILDNFEDIEDNVKDSNVNSLRDEFQTFLHEFSKIDSPSRIIITTRSSPMAVAHGIHINQLTKREASDLFLRKLLFRSQRARIPNPELAEILQDGYLRIFTDKDAISRLIEAFDVWGDNDKHIAHPLMVLCAAESVQSSDFNEIQDVIKGWNDGRQASDIIEYCVSKTLGSFNQSEVDVIQLLTLSSQNSTDITPEFIQTKLSEVEKGTFSASWLTEEIRARLDTVGDDAYIDLRWKLIDRSFLQNSPNDVRTIWNHIAYKHLLSRFGGQIETIIEEEVSEDITLDSVPIIGIEAMAAWLDLKTHSRNDWKPVKWTKAALIEPISGVTTKLLQEIERRSDGEAGKYPMEEIVEVLEKQSLLLIRFFEQIESVILKRDQTLSMLIPSGQHAHQYLFEFFKILYSHAKAWRILSQITSDSKKKLWCEASLICHEHLRFFLSTMFKSNLIHSSDWIEIMLNIGDELAMINVEQTTQIEVLGTMQLRWLRRMGDEVQPGNCSLRDLNGLSFDDFTYTISVVWRRLFSALVFNERSNLMQLVEGQSFWMHLRSYSTHREDVTENDLRVLDILKNQGNAYARKPNIDQYIRSVQTMYRERVSEANAYVKSFRQFRTQPANGTLIIASIEFNINMNRWEQQLESEWKLIVEPNGPVTEHKIEACIVKQIDYQGVDKRIIAIFVEDEHGNILTDVSGNMETEKAMNNTIGNVINRAIEDAKKNKINALSAYQIRRVLEGTGASLDSDSINRYAKMVDLHLNRDYYVIDKSLPFQRPRPEYKSLPNSDFIVHVTHNKNGLQLPEYPETFSSMLSVLYQIKQNKSSFRLNDYVKLVRKEKLSGPNGALNLYWALGNKSWKTDWLNEVFASEDVREWNVLKKKLATAMMNKAKRLNNISISKKVIETYLEEMDDPSI